MSADASKILKVRDENAKKMSIFERHPTYNNL